MGKSSEKRERLKGGSRNEKAKHRKAQAKAKRPALWERLPKKLKLPYISHKALSASRLGLDAQA